MISRLIFLEHTYFSLSVVYVTVGTENKKKGDPEEVVKSNFLLNNFFFQGLMWPRS